MSKEEIIHKINTALAQEFEKSENELTPMASMKDTLELDSLDIVDLVVMVENLFHVRLKKEELMQVTTFQSFYDLVWNRMNH